MPVVCLLYTSRFSTRSVENSSSFSDISGHWAENEIERAAAFGWISGYPDGTCLLYTSILGAAPFAAMGFVTYHGMTAEQFVWAWLRSEVLEPKVIRFQSNNIYYEALKPELEKKEKEGMKNHD